MHAPSTRHGAPGERGRSVASQKGNALNRKLATALLLAVLVPAAAAAAWWYWPPRVQTATPTRGAAIDAVYATGTVRPAERRRGAPRSGARLQAVAADEGQRVRRGQVLARVESRDLDQTVEEMRAREQLAQAQFERNRTLLQQHFISTAEFDRARSELQAAQAATRRAQALNEYNQLVAPADGVVLRRDGEAGQFVPPGQAVFILACCAPLRVSAEVDEEDITRVFVGQPASMRSDAMPERIFEGTVSDITPKGDPVSRSYRVRIRLTDAPSVEGGPMRSGMTVDANLIVSRRDGALLVPSSAIKAGQVWLLANGRLHRTAVTRGSAGAAQTEILSGLKDTDVVVLSPADNLREAQWARGAPATVAPLRVSPMAQR